MSQSVPPGGFSGRILEEPLELEFGSDCVWRENARRGDGRPCNYYPTTAKEGRLWMMIAHSQYLWCMMMKNQKSPWHPHKMKHYYMKMIIILSLDLWMLVQIYLPMTLPSMLIQLTVLAWMTKQIIGPRPM